MHNTQYVARKTTITAQICLAPGDGQRALVTRFPLFHTDRVATVGLQRLSLRVCGYGKRERERGRKEMASGGGFIHHVEFDIF